MASLFNQRDETTQWNGWRIFHICMAVDLVLIAIALSKWGAVEIRTDGENVFILTLLGFLWLKLATKCFSWLGLSFRDDVLERKNAAALIALYSALTGMAILYAGGSAGEGPSEWNNFFSAGLGAAAWFAFWILLELAGKVGMSIAEERDVPSGIRLGSYLLASALLGRAVAGDWHSASATVHDLIRDGWPATTLCVVAVLLESFTRPTKRKPFPEWVGCGLLPALVYMAPTSVWLWHLGAWEGMY